MRVLVACEYSGRVRDAFRALGHDAWSCDILPTEADPAFHIEAPVQSVLYLKWDMMIGHPPCTFMANSANKHLYLGMKKENGRNEDRWKSMEEGAAFFRMLWNADIPHIALENPVMVGHARELVRVRFSQSIQPWQFGHMEVKRTCLWLKNLPPLVASNNVYDEMMRLDYRDRAKVHHEAPGEDRWKNRSRTYAGIAQAMADQWSAYIAQKEAA